MRVFKPNGILAPFQFHSVSVPFHFVPFCLCDIETCYFPCAHKGPVNASFRAEDVVQLLHMVADGTKAPAFAKLQSY